MNSQGSDERAFFFEGRTKWGGKKEGGEADDSTPGPTSLLQHSINYTKYTLVKDAQN